MRRTWTLLALALAIALAMCSRTGLRGGEATSDPCAGCDSVCIEDRCVGVAQIAAAADHTCALVETGEVMCWGSNAAGILGNGRSDAQSHPTPALVPGIGNVLQIAVSSTHACARHANGSITCWGSDPMGDGFLRPALVSGIGDATDVAVGPRYSCAMTKEGSVFCWGWDSSGQLGDARRFGSTMSPRPLALPAVSSFALATNHACAATAGGEVWCWGSNTLGQIGRGSSFTDVTSPLKVTTLTWVTGASAGSEKTCAVRRNGVLACWGGALSASFPTDTRNAVDVAGVALAESNDALCLLGRDGSIACGRLVLDKKLGGMTYAGTTVVKSGATSVTLGTDHGCALLADGVPACWGNNSSGQLGDGTTESRAAPGNVRF
jgi:alpha-tubulin suppressor-like RCC1 family protein